MRNSYAFIKTRRNKIYKLLKQHGSIKVKDLAEQLNTSPLTIRRDLEHLEEQGLIERFYGGATLRENPIQTNSLGLDLDDDVIRYKQAIAKRAVEFIVDGDTVFINSSSTALLMLNYITAKNVTIITNNGRTILSDAKKDVSVVLLGGELQISKKSMVGEFALNNLSRVNATKAFLGCSGLTAEEGFTTANMHEVAINQLMLSRVTGERFILADHTKIGKKHSFVSGSPEQISCVITDTEANKTVLDSLARRGVKIIQVPPLQHDE